MVKFFKELRRKLLAQNRFRRYFFYAVGEIVLVVIGILIALSINNWNEEQKEEAATLNYLSNLRDALDDDIASFESNLSFNKTRLRGIYYILQQAGLNTGKFTEMEWIDVSKNTATNALWQGDFPDTINRNFTNLAFSLLGRGFGGISLNKTVINELYSTGYFSHIKNQNLKTQLGHYYSFLAQRFEGYAIEEHEEWANETTRFLRDKYGIFTLDVSDFEDPIAALKNQKEAEHQLRYLALEVNYHCIWTQEATKKALNLVGLIKQEENRLKK